MAEENARLRTINAKMLAALRYVFTFLKEGLPATANFDWSQEAVAKVQDARPKQSVIPKGRRKARLIAHRIRRA